MRDFKGFLKLDLIFNKIYSFNIDFSDIFLVILWRRFFDMVCNDILLKYEFEALFILFLIYFVSD